MALSAPEHSMASAAAAAGPAARVWDGPLARDGVWDAAQRRSNAMAENPLIEQLKASAAANVRTSEQNAAQHVANAKRDAEDRSRSRWPAPLPPDPTADAKREADGRAACLAAGYSPNLWKFQHQFTPEQAAALPKDISERDLVRLVYAMDLQKCVDITKARLIGMAMQAIHEVDPESVGLSQITTGVSAAATRVVPAAAAAAGVVVEHIAARDHKVDDPMGMHAVNRAVGQIGDEPKRACDEVQRVQMTRAALCASQFFAPDKDQIIAVIYDPTSDDDAKFRLILDRDDTRGYCMVLHRKHGLPGEEARMADDDESNAKKRRMGGRDVVKALGMDAENKSAQPQIQASFNINYFADQYEHEALSRIQGLIMMWLCQHGVPELSFSSEPYLFSQSLPTNKRVSLGELRLGIPRPFVPHMRFWVRWGDSAITSKLPNELPQRNGQPFVATPAVPFKPEDANARASLRRFLAKSLKTFVAEGGEHLFSAQLKIADE